METKIYDLVFAILCVVIANFVLLTILIFSVLKSSKNDLNSLEESDLESIERKAKLQELKEEARKIGIS